MENLVFSVGNLFPLFQRGSRLREQTGRGLKFFFQVPPGFFCFYKRNGVVIQIKSINKNHILFGQRRILKPEDTIRKPESCNKKGASAGSAFLLCNF
ncbi:MAG: hypothetical protein E7482_06845 [Ruminococcaceae bacterium]|nr:hypothetical protein [Oscillospiraceae bacterium]